ncbi:MAG: DM13 domain-containing protein [Pseudomonadota bacterium]
MSKMTRAAQVLTLLYTILSAATLFGLNASAEDASGTWIKRSQTIKGTWSIVETDEGRFLELDAAFKTRNAPDLKLFLSPLDASDVKAKNATSGSVLIAPLRKNKGAQRYRIPADIDLDQFKTLVLHCEQYTKLWGVSAL